MSNINNDEVIGLEFGVSGGDDIGDGSGKRIYDQLKSIRDKINKTKELNVDIGIAGTSLTQIKEDLKEIIQELEDKFKNIGVGSKKNGGSNKGESTYDKTYVELKSIEDERLKLARQLGSATDKNNNKFKVQEAVFNELTDNANELRKNLSKELPTFLSDNIKTIETQIEQLRKKTEIELPDGSKQKKFVETDFAKQIQKINSGAALDKLENSYSKESVKAIKGVWQQHQELIKTNTEAAQIYDNLIKLTKEYNKALEDGDIDVATQKQKELREALSKGQIELTKIDQKTDTFGKNLMSKLGQRAMQMLAYSIVGILGNALRQVYQNVVKLDKAVVDLQVATGLSRAQTKELIKDYAVLAKEIGATTIEVAEAADTWLRQGYSIEEANKLIKDSMMLSKLGQLSAAESAKALTSAIKGYKIEVEDATKIVDKFTSVDMVAAVNAGDIATAMAETAAGAKVAGVSFDNLTGYIATVAEVTQDGAESVGTFFKTLFARMGNVKAGKFVDEETGEALNDVENVLSSVGIRLRDTSGQFIEFDNVLDDVAKRWKQYDSVQKHAIATAFAGTRQQEKFIVLMENYGKALEYANTAATSDGTAEQKYDAAYLQSVEASINSLKAVWESFSAKVLDSDLIKTVVQGLSWIAKGLDFVADKLGSNATTAALLGSALAVASKSLAVFKNTEIWVKLSKLFSKTTNEAGELVGVFGKLGKGFKNLFSNGSTYAVLLAAFTTLLRDAHPAINLVITAVTSLGIAVALCFKKIRAAMLTNPFGLFIFGVTAVISLGKALYDLANANSYETLKAKADELRKEWQDAKNELDDLNESLETNEERLKELNEIKEDGGLWTAELEAERKAIEKENARLESQKKILEQVNSEKQKAAQLADYEAWKAYQKDTDQTGWQKFWGTGDKTTEQEDFEKNMAILTNGIDVSKDPIVKLYEQIENEAKKRGDKDLEDEARDYKERAKKKIEAEAAEIISNAKIDVSEYVEKALDYVNIYDYTGDPIFDDNLNEAWEVVDKYYANLGEFGTLWDSLISRKPFEELFNVEYDENGNKTFVGIAQQLADNFTISADTIKNAVNDTEDPLHGFVTYLGKLNLLNDKADYSNIANQILNMSDGFTNVNLEEYTNMFSKITSGYDIMRKAKEELKDLGVISSETINEIVKDDELMRILNGNPDSAADDLLKKGKFGYEFVIPEGKEYSGKSEEDIFFDRLGEVYKKQLENTEEVMKKVAKTDTQGNFLKDEQGNYIPLDGISDYVLKTAVEDYNNALKNQEEWEIAVSVTTRTEDIEAFRKKLEEEKENLEERSDQYKDFIDLRKELLESYRDEINYQKELAQKTKNVADIQTRLSLAKLDNSAAGKARQRELQEELNKAQEELNEYTLDKAIDDLLAELDNSADEYEKFIKSQIEIIAGKLDNIAVAYEEANPTTIATPKYHTGGFVADQVKIKSNETFAKLLNGELVSTPAQMDNFIKNTLPQLAETAGGGAVIQNNSPLVQINCGNITEEALPDFEKIVDSAVKEVEKNMERALSRAGFKK